MQETLKSLYDNNNNNNLYLSSFRFTLIQKIINFSFDIFRNTSRESADTEVSVLNDSRAKWLGRAETR